MKLRLHILLPALLAAGGLLAAPAALAADQAVTATSANTFSPFRVAVKPGEKVTYSNAGGDHNVVWNDGAVPDMPSDAVPPEQWPPPGGVSRTFTRNGTFRYYCEIHGSASGDFGMVGYVHVNAVGQVPPVVSGLTASGSRAGARLRFRSSRAGRATATFFRRTRGRFVRFGAASFAAKSGANSKLVSRAGRRLAPGSYRVDLVVVDAARLRSDKRSRTLRIPS
jgi:plastocyanin